MIKMRNISIAYKVIITLVVVVSAFLSAAGLIVYKFYKEQNWSELQEHSRILMEQSAIGYSQPLWNLDSDQIKRYTESIMQDQSVDAVVVRESPSGRIVLSKERNSTQGTADNNKLISSNLILNEKPIYYLDAEIGTVQLFVNPKFVQQRLRNSFYAIILCITGLTIILILTLFPLLWKIVISPLKQIETFALSVRNNADGAGQTLTTPFQGEFQTLRDSLNQMLTLLNSRFAELAQRNIELENATERLQLATKASKIGIWDWDIINNNLVWDDSMYSLYGIRSEDFNNAYEAWLRTVHPDDKARTEGEIAAALNGEREYAPQFRILLPNGSVRYIQAYSKTFRDKNGKPLRMIGTNIDISESKKAKEELQRKESELRSLFDNIDSPASLLDTDKRYVIFNNELKKTHFLLTGKELKTGQTPFDPYLAEVSEQRTKMLDNVLKGNKEVMEGGFNMNGKYMYFKSSYTPVITDGKITGISHMAVNLTEIKETEQKFKSLVEQSLVGVYIIQNNKIVYVNPKCCEQFGYPEEELLEKSIIDVVHEEDRQMVLGIMEERVKNNIPTTNYQFRGVRKDGSIAWFELFGSSILYKGAFAVIGSLIDITERKKMIGDLLQRNKDLEQFAYIVSHNLRAPVANIIGISDLLADGSSLPVEVQAELNEGLINSVARLDDVVKDLNNILNVRRTINETKEMVSFTELINNITSSISNLIDISHVQIKCNFTVDEFVTIKSYFYSIFYNLISNSIKYRRADVPCIVEISSRKHDNKLELIFKDNGIGIDLEKRGEQVFGLYKRFHTNVEGKGVGLYMVKTQVETLGGKISVASEVNKGTEFKIEFEI